MNIFQQYAASQVSPSMEADVNINIDVNEGARTMAPVDTSTVVEAPAIEPAVDPLEGTSPEAPAVDPIAPEQTESVTTEVPPAEEPAAAIDGEAQAEVDAVDTATAEEAASDEEVAVEETAEPTDEEVEQALEDDAEEAEEKAEVVEDVKSSLESVYETLASMESAGVQFDDGHATLTAIALNTTMSRMGGKAADICPSLESDNFFERTDLTASMESIGSAIGAAAKAAGKAILQAIRTAIEYLKKKFASLGALKERFTKGKDIARRMPSDKYAEVTVSCPFTKEINADNIPTSAVFRAIEQWREVVDIIVSSGDDFEKISDLLKPVDGRLSMGVTTITVSKVAGRELQRMFVECEDLIKRIENSKIIERLEKMEKAYQAFAESDDTKQFGEDGAKRMAKLRSSINFVIEGLRKFKVEGAAA